jgi:acetyl esterase/lipase
MNYSKQTYTYKTVQDCQIQADVYQLVGEERRPVILWLHGGALMFGDRNMLALDQVQRYLAAGYTVVSIDYRLAPETKLQAILEDLQDAYKWVRGQGPARFHIDPDRLALIGHSAGGYLTLMAGFCLEPRPNALVSFYGYGDIAGEWYSGPSPHHCKIPAIPRDVAYQAVGGAVIAASPVIGRPSPRGLFYIYCRQQGLWPLVVTGHDPHTEAETFERLCPIRHISNEYPPTLLLHGDQDSDVPFEQSKLMADALAEHQVPHGFVTMEGFDHLFDVFPEGFEFRAEGGQLFFKGDPVGLRHPKVAEAFEAVVSFLQMHLGR